MKILHTTPNLSLSYGGPTQSVFYTVEGLRVQGLDVDILTYQPDIHDRLIADDEYIIALPLGKSSFVHSSGYKHYLKNHSYDLYHAQGIWQYPTSIAAKIARKQNKPYIITPRGMLYPQALAASKLKKQIFLKLFLLNDLNKAATVQATCEEEMHHLRNVGVKTPIAVIPNPIHVQDRLPYAMRNAQFKLGYLGRVHPRKNIERIIYAWEKSGNKTTNSELVIIGDGDKSYLDFLKAETTRLNLKNVVFTGFLSGEAKEKMLNALSYLVVPSDFENFGMIIPEALTKGIPVIASKGTPWEELNTHRCGWWVDNDVDTLAATIEQALQLPKTTRIEMGRRGQELVKNNYSVEVVAKKMIRLYEWILSGGQKPEFVYLS
ncbi:glycosyl transferase family 1 [Bacteroidia bacterium]|nr:glycosyl transferase family 1 [Bacteroidia bacterium]